MCGGGRDRSSRIVPTTTAGPGRLVGGRRRPRGQLHADCGKNDVIMSMHRLLSCFSLSHRPPGGRVRLLAFFSGNTAIHLGRDSDTRRAQEATRDVCVSCVSHKRTRLARVFILTGHGRATLPPFTRIVAGDCRERRARSARRAAQRATASPNNTRLRFDAPLPVCTVQ